MDVMGLNAKIHGGESAKAMISEMKFDEPVLGKE